MAREPAPSPRKGTHSILDSVATLSIIAACVTMIAVLLTERADRNSISRDIARRSVSAAPGVPAEPVSLKGAATRGTPSAPVAIIVFSDFQCPYCATFTLTTLPAIEEKYLATGKALLAFRHLPLERIHPAAFEAAEAAECASRQGKFWEMHDRLFSDPKGISGASISRDAATLNLNLAEFNRCVSGEADAVVRADLAGAKALGITGTPTFLIGRVEPDGRVKVLRRLSGARPAGEFQQVLDEVVSSSRDAAA